MTPPQSERDGPRDGEVVVHGDRAQVHDGERGQVVGQEVPGLDNFYIFLFVSNHISEDDNNYTFIYCFYKTIYIPVRF